MSQANPEIPSLRLGFWWLGAMTQRYEFFSRAAKNIKMATFSLISKIEGLRPCLSKPSYRAPKWGLMVRLIQKERLKSPQKSPILENQESSHFWVILAILAKTAILVSFWPAISKPGWTHRKKVPLGIRLKSTRPSHGRVLPKLDPPEARQNFRRPGLSSFVS